MLVVVKQIYASHYIQAGVKVYAVLPVSDTDPSQGVYVMLTQRLRFDGEVKGIKRSALESGTKKGGRIGRRGPGDVPARILQDQDDPLHAVDQGIHEELEEHDVVFPARVVDLPVAWLIFRLARVAAAGRDPPGEPEHRVCSGRTSGS